MGGQGSKPSSPRAGSPKAAPPPREPVASDPVPVAPPTPGTSPAPEQEPAPPEARAVRAVDPRWAKVSARFAEISDRLDAIERRVPAPAGPGAPIPAGAPETSRRDDTCDAARRILADLVDSRGAPPGCARFVRVPANYYDEPLEFRRRCVGGATVDHMCKTIVMENTRCVNDDCADAFNSRWYLVVVQYTARLNQQKLEKFLHELNNVDGRRCGKKNFNMRLAKEEDSERLTGYVKGAVCPFGCAEKRMPVILSDKIVALEPQTFWLGAGEVDLKVGMSAADFVARAEPHVTDITY